MLFLFFFFSFIGDYRSLVILTESEADNNVSDRSSFFQNREEIEDDFDFTPFRSLSPSFRRTSTPFPDTSPVYSPLPHTSPVYSPPTSSPIPCTNPSTSRKRCYTADDETTIIFKRNKNSDLSSSQSLEEKKEDEDEDEHFDSKDDDLLSNMLDIVEGRFFFLIINK